MQPAPVASQPLAPSPQPLRVRSSPLARRLAAERGLDLKLVTGTGPAGRVTKRDVEAAGPAMRVAAAAPAPAAVAAPAGGFRDAPLTTMRKTIARRLSESLGPVPHFFLTSEIGMERAWEARQHLAGLGQTHVAPHSFDQHRSGALLEPAHHL